MSEDARVEECRRLLEEMVDVDCRSGAYEEASIVAAIAETIEGDLGAPHPELLRELTERARAGLAAYEQAERTWQGRTVNDAIESAFGALTDRGVLAIEGLGSTVQEGWARAEELSAGLRGVRGFVFFHRQDLERALRGERLLLAFGALSSMAPATAATEPAERGDLVRFGIQRADLNPVGHGSDHDATRAIGREVVAMLKHHGIDTQWDGSARVRIAIPPFAWQKRRTTVAPPASALPPLTGDLAALPPEPPAPAVCPDCRGRGFLPPLHEGWGSELCWCQGGVRRAPAEAKVTPEVREPVAPAAPAEGPPSEAPSAAPREGGVLGWIKRWLG